MLLSTARSGAFLGNIFGKSTSVQIGSNGNCWLGLFTAAPQPDGTGYAEVGSGKNYSRVEISEFMTVTGRTASNSQDINFNAAIVPSDPDAQTGADWGQVVAFGLFTTRTGSDLYAWGSLKDGGSQILTKSTYHILAGKLQVADDGSLTAEGTV